jgi:salicylate hydroxylase
LLGISLAVEDAVALRECISLAQSQDAEQPNIAFDLRPALEVFESLRKPRAEAIQKASLHAGNVLQLPAGPERDARDAAMKADRPADKIQAQYAYGIADQAIRDWCYGYDAAEVVRKEWKRRLEAQARSK